MDTQGQGSVAFAGAMGAVADQLLGPRNVRLSTESEIRYGAHGSLSVDLAAGRYYDHETKQGGGVLDLISRQLGIDHKAGMEWLRQRGLIETESAPKANGSEHAKKTIVATYDYTDESGELIFQVVRFEPKTFVQRRKERGRWVYQVRGVRQVPYRLPELVEAIASERTVFIVEGEKDVENLAKLGIVATCNAGGAGKWPDGWAEIFTDADVVIIPDNDQAGRDHAALVARSLGDAPRHLRLLTLPDLPLKGDVSDWMAAGGSAEALHALAEKAPAFGSQIQSRFGGLRWEDIGTTTGGYQWLVEDVIPLGEISLVYGDSGTGKSFDMFDMSMCVARGVPFNGRNVEAGLVVYVAAEAGKGFSKRKIAYAVQHQLDPAKPLPFYLCTKRPNFFHDDADAIALIDEIRRVAAAYNVPLRLIVIDTLSALAPGMNENASQDVSMVRKRLVMLQEQFEAAIILVHHKPKGGSTPRGHGSLTADFETTIEFETMTDLKTPDGRTIHKATVRKQREGKNGIAWSFTLPVVEVGRNKWGNPETSCVVHPLSERTTREASVGFHATAPEKLFLHALYEALAEHPLPPPTGLPKEIARVVNYRHVYELMKSRFINPEEDQDKADARFRQAFRRAANALRDGAVIGVQGELFWPTGKPVNGFTSPKIDGGDF